LFTGIVEELGHVRSITPNEGGARIEIAATRVLADATLGASIAVNGCCLTVVAFDAAAGWWAADAVVETLQRTNLGALGAGDPVNLERPLRIGDRLGGHLVQGHVDTTGSVSALTRQTDGSLLLSIDAPRSILRYLVEKGSITVDGISLTVVGVTDTSFTIAVIPHTQAVTTIANTAIGTSVNLEADMIAKHVERLLTFGETGAT
jgi:riboflavin synthase